MPMKFLLPFFLLGVAPCALAQSPGQNISVALEVRSVSVRADTTGVSYVLTVLPGSQEALSRFSIDAPAGVLRIAPQNSLWVPLTEFQGRSVGHWITADSLPAGSVTPELTYEAIGLAGILTYWVGGVFPFPSVEDMDPVGSSDPMVSEMINGPTVGVEAWPANRAPAALLTRLRNLAQRTCTTPLMWITSSSLCSQLTAYVDEAELHRASGQLSAARTSLDSLITALSGSAPGTFAPGVNSSAYWLLRTNAQIIRDSL